MYPFFLLPLILSIVAAVMVVLLDEFRWITKSVVVLLVAGTAVMQFVPLLQDSIHFLVPLFLQLAVCGWWYFAVLNPPP